MSNSLIPLPSGKPDFSNVIHNPNISLRDQRDHVLRGLGLKGTKQRYGTPAERKAASKARRDERRTKRLDILKEYGLEPRKKVKLSKQEKSIRRRTRAASKREFLHRFTETNPEEARRIATELGIRLPRRRKSTKRRKRAR